MDLASCHDPGVSNFEVGPTFLENLYMSGMTIFFKK